MGTGAIHIYLDGLPDSFYSVVEIVAILKIKEGNEYVIAFCSLVFMTRHVKHSATLYKTSNNHPVSCLTYTVAFTQHRVGTCMDPSV